MQRRNAGTQYDSSDGFASLGPLYRLMLSHSGRCTHQLRSVSGALITPVGLRSCRPGSHSGRLSKCLLVEWIESSLLATRGASNQSAPWRNSYCSSFHRRHRRLSSILAARLHSTSRTLWSFRTNLTKAGYFLSSSTQSTGNSARRSCATAGLRSSSGWCSATRGILPG